MSRRIRDDNRFNLLRGWLCNERQRGRINTNGGGDAAQQTLQDWAAAARCVRQLVQRPFQRQCDGWIGRSYLVQYLDAATCQTTTPLSIFLRNRISNVCDGDHVLL